jgi:D-beta-D-heptose 7-phosphate kinase/D-beta-D-heptose 1-phosphate adenosyltransferase
MRVDSHSIRQIPPEEKIKSYGEMAGILRQLRFAGMTIVLAQGVFDIVHRGHVGYLRASSRIAADNCFLVVGLENNESIKKNKGDNRPINLLEDRLHVVSEFMSVGLVFAYEDMPDYNNPEDFIRRYEFLKAAAIAVPTWDPHRNLKEWQASQAGSKSVLVNYKHVNSTTKMLKRLGWE